MTVPAERYSGTGVLTPAKSARTWCSHEEYLSSAESHHSECVTGRIGKQVLDQAIQEPTITSVIALSRRPLPDLVRHTKLKVLVLEDFEAYSNDVVAELQDADACIWCMTTTAGDPVLELRYPRAFADAIAPSLASSKKRFRYVHVSGAMVERDQTKSLWMKASVRKTKGEGETQMIEVAKLSTHGGCWETMVARPGMVVQRGSVAGEASMWLSFSGAFIRADELALALVDAAMQGGDELLLPAVLLQRGQEVFKSRSRIRAD